MPKRINYFLYQLLVIFIFYDLILENSIFIGLMKFKYLVIGLLLLSALIKRIKFFDFKVFNLGFILFFGYHIILGIASIPGFSYYGVSGFMVYKQYFFFPILIYLFYNFNTLTGIKINVLYLFIAKVAVIYVLINTFLYHVHLPIWSPNNYRPWWGRMTQGYPTIDVISLAYTLALLFLYEYENITKTRRLLYSIIILLGIVVLASGTGFVFIALILCATITALIFSSGEKVKNLRQNISYICISTIIFITLSASLLKSMNDDSFDMLWLVAENRIGILLGTESTIQYNTMDMRKEQYDLVKESFQKDTFDQIFGVGFSAVDYSVGYPDGKIYVENQFGLNYITSGILGNIFYLLMLFLMPISIFFGSKYTFTQKVLAVLSSVIFALASYTTVPLASYSAIAAYSILYSRFLILRNKKTDVNNLKL